MTKAETDGFDELESAQHNYESGDFDGAVRAYKSAIQHGLDNGHVYYNLGNSYYRAGQIGMAIWAYRCALLDIPRSAELLANLSLARKQTQDVVDEERSYSGAVDLLVMPLRLLNRYELTMLVFTTYTLASLLFGAWLVFKKRALLVTSCYLVALAAYLLFVDFAGSYNRAGAPVIGGLFSRDDVAGVIVSKKVEVRSGNGGSYQVVFILNEGTEIMAGEKRGDWIEVKVTDSKKGWVELEHIALVM